jgi:ATP-dependent DNA helicase RecQ
LKLLYLSPETLFSPMVWETLLKKEIKISYLILDEAHCLVQWGDTFRPAYRRLGEVRSSLLTAKNQSENITIAAFTATADPVAQTTINEVLKLEQPEIFLMNPYRQNINIKVEYVFVPKCREERLLKFIKNHANQSGLVYARTRKDCEILVELLTSKGYNTVAYHGGLSADERRKIEAQWLSGNMLFVVCTCAFGMGVNKPDVRWVVHYQPAYLLSEYVQEIGRAGRDGQPAKALILICEPTGLLYPEDQQRQKYFSEQWRSQYQTALQIGKKIPDQGEITEIEKRYKEGGISLAILHSLGQIKWLDAFNYEKTGKVDKKLQEKLQKQQQKQQRQMQEYLWSQECRWKYILTAFGFTKEAIAFKCGHCDRCH